MDRHIFVLDHNEVVVPLLPVSGQASTTMMNLPQLMKYLESRATAAGSRRPINYAFYNSDHYTDGGRADLTMSPYTTLLRYRHRAPTSAYGHDMKSVIDPRGCVNMHTQYCWGAVTADSNQNYIEVLEPTVALKNTYRSSFTFKLMKKKSPHGDDCNSLK